MTERECVICHTTFKPTNWKQQTCHNSDCKNTFYYRKRRNQSQARAELKLLPPGETMPCASIICTVSAHNRANLEGHCSVHCLENTRDIQAGRTPKVRRVGKNDVVGDMSRHELEMRRELKAARQAKMDAEDWSALLRVAEKS